MRFKDNTRVESFEEQLVAWQHLYASLHGRNPVQRLSTTALMNGVSEGSVNQMPLNSIN
ncbi:MAG: hypothetical protein KME25_05225 [Symplocastrum torsivum CPER-KK1]|uniref:Uncharacterized protein n=1 Tax=Symplocastrum torsivum CPER-KK1 TaxID=450513 RepID=A0A951PHA8_9CYAN|nr:hypothetical protein [Microcoleus sp. FACHB-SPT15]MBD1809944.1 hypothetical protein [Microcoleus sp. FACHB-SPT15]MBW4543835.1 hypothetical protein [Symplocastrum torsivum CPER-KK1]